MFCWLSGLKLRCFKKNLISLLHTDTQMENIIEIQYFSAKFVITTILVSAVYPRFFGAIKVFEYVFIFFISTLFFLDFFNGF